MKIKNKWLLAAVLAACGASGHAQKQYDGFQSPVGIVAHDGALYVSDWSTNNVSRIQKNGHRSVVASDIAAAAGLAADKQGHLYISSYSGHYIVRLERNGAVRRIVENLATPTGIAFARNGELLVANRAAGTVLRVNVDKGSSRVVADGFDLPVGVVEMPGGDIVVSQYGGRVTRVLKNGEKQELGQSFVRPGVGIAADGDNAVLVVDNGAGVVRRVDFNGASVVISPKLAGSVVALGKGVDGEWLAGTWGDGGIYRIDYRSGE